MAQGKKEDTKVLVASMESSSEQNVVALLVAAAFGSWNIDETSEGEAMKTDGTAPGASRVFVAGQELELSSWESFVELIDKAIGGMIKLSDAVDAPSFLDEDTGVATTKAVINLMDRHLNDNEALYLITSSHLTLPEDVMKNVTEKGCTVHCHDVDDMGERLDREKAEKGDVTISLAWDTEDDLDLHVFLPNGVEIYFSNKTSCDCHLDVDMNAGGVRSKQPVENVICGNLDERKQAPTGKYKVVVQNYAYHTKPPRGDIPFRVVVEKNGIKEKFTGKCNGSGASSNVTVCEFEYNGRTIPFPMDQALMTAFETSNVVNLSASTGQTLESLSQLVKTAQQRQHLETVRTLVNEQESTTATATTTNDDEPSLPAVANSGTIDTTSNGEPSRPTVANTRTIEVTSREQMMIQLTQLPQRFHLLVGEHFGGDAGPTLAEHCAAEIAKRMVAENIHIDAFKGSGYPDDIVQAVRTKMATSVMES